MGIRAMTGQGVAVAGTAPPPEGPAGNLGTRVRTEQVRLLYRQLPVSISGSMVAVAVLCALMWNAVAHGVLLGWAAVMAANQSWRLLFYLRFRREGLDDARAVSWGRYWAGGAFASGLIWGAASVLLFVPGSQFHQTVLLVVLFAITAVGVPMLSGHRPSLYLFMLPALLPVIARNVWEGGDQHLIIAFVAFSTMLGVLSVGLSYNRLLREALRNRFVNEELAGRLAAQNAEVEAARRVAEESSRAKTQFFAAASHDLRQPLHAMGLFAAALQEKVRDPEVTGVVNSINASVEALENLFNALLDISKIDAGVIVPEPRHFSLDELMDRLRMDHEAEAFEKGIELRVRPSGAWVRSDPVLLERILRNLIGNALRYTRRGGILAGARVRGNAIRIEIWDTGVGIPPAEQAKVFEEFYQIGNPERSSRKGLGLGLAIIRRLARLLDHPLGLRSVPGRGSVFWVEVPRGRRPPARKSTTAAGAQPGGDIAGRLVVVIDDEAAITEGMRVLLAGWGCQVIAAASLAEASAALDASGKVPDLVIADYRLSEGEVGADAIEALRRRFGSRLPAIMVTGSATPERSAEATARGYHLVLKPLIPGRLRALIGLALGARAGAPEAQGPPPSLAS